MQYTTTDKSAVPVISLAIDQPVTIVGGDGKEYKVVLQAVEEKPDRKRKLLNTSYTPKPKRAPGLTLANMSIEEINKRKREQNRIAAQRYRQKQKCSKDADKEVSLKCFGEHPHHTSFLITNACSLHFTICKELFRPRGDSSRDTWT
ncbi:unnamed protein product [Angiostrongylus costaricensis]|uniref:BZIP domain-containing protein n=1 Tax=Angiostrongylus costaricensis TaxID=334426 RepID=A0A0R3PKA4_ANGCS|nr:unnamed protein product [Angiostrongylus costaricensis]